MATDLERLVVSLDADITKLTKQLSRAGVQLDGFDRDVDQKTKRIAKRANDNLGAIANDNRALRGDQLRNLGFQLNDITSGLASGQSPMTILAQQGGQVYQVLGDAKGGVGGAVKDLAARLFGLVTPIRVAAGGVLSIAAAAAYLGTEWLASQDKAQAALRGIGGASGATVGQINRVAAAASSAGVISTGAARDIATAFAATGKIDVGQFGGLLDLAPGFAKVFTDGDLAKAGPEMARIFADPVKGADELDARLGVLDDRTRQYIRTLAAQGDRQGAIAVLARAVAPELARAAEQTGIWAKAWNAVKSAADGAGEAVARAVSKGTLREQATAAEGQRRAVSSEDRARRISPEQSPLLNNPFSQEALKETSTALRQATDEAQHLDEVARRASQGAYFETVAKQANDLAKAAGDVVRAFNAEGEGIQDLENRYVLLGKAIEDYTAVGKLDDADKARASYGSLGERLKQLQAEYAKGGAAAAAALRQANFQAATAGLSTFAKGLAEIKRQYDDLERAARATVDAAKLPGALATIEQARGAATAAYTTEAGERAKGEVTVSPDISRIVFGAEGNNPAKNPKSSASGYGQFIDSTFVSLYRKEFSNLASGMTDAAILAMKSDRGVNEKLVEAYARENAVKLNAAGLNGNKVENQYLAHNYGPAGAIGLLKADPNASATSVLGQGVANANPAVAGHTVQDVINESYGRAQRYSGAGRAQTGQVISDRASAESYDKPAAAAARLAAIQEQLNQDREKGGELGERYATAEDLIKAKTDALTPALKGQRDEIMKLADERARAAGTKLGTTFAIDTSEAYGALGRSANEQSAYTTAKQFGAPGSEGFRSAYDEALKLKELTDAKSDTGGFLKGLAADMMNGVKAGQALENQLKRIVAKIADRAIDGLVNSLFSGSGGGDSKGGATAGASGGFNFGSIFSSVGKIFGFDSGGFTGPGGKFEPAGVVHKGEVVWSQADVGRWGGAAMVDAMRRSRGFADGGIVGPIVTPRIPMARPAGGGSTSVGGMTLVQHIHGGGDDAIASIARQASAQAVGAYDGHLRRNLPAMVGAAQRRGF